MRKLISRLTNLAEIIPHLFLSDDVIFVRENIGRSGGSHLYKMGMHL
jgi:hypothetical protein